MNTLRLTSPFIKSADVKIAQTLLTQNPYGNFHPGAIDSTYGEATAAAARRAKFALGYPTDQIDEAFGEILAVYLTGKKKLPLLYALRRKRRLASQPVASLGQKALATAINQIGIAESPPGSNNVVFSRWYGIRGPWCAMFVSWNYVTAGAKSFRAGSHYSYCPFLLADARAGRNSLEITHDPKPGDIVLYCWDGSRVPEHAGLFKEWADAKHTTVTSVEGNTSGTNQANGGQVMERQRVISLVVAFIHVT